MKKHIYVINGSGGVGKDTFVELIKKCLQDRQLNGVLINFSSVDDIKRIAYELGWDGGKSEKDRKFLSDLKYLATEYNDFPFNCMKKMVHSFKADEVSLVLFLHIREPKEIERAVAEFGCKTILIKRDRVKHITTNMADKNVFNYKYDFVIENNGTLDELRQKCNKFVEEIVLKE